jgi:hypothetical protein
MIAARAHTSSAAVTLAIPPLAITPRFPSGIHQFSRSIRGLSIVALIAWAWTIVGAHWGVELQMLGLALRGAGDADAPIAAKSSA